MVRVWFSSKPYKCFVGGAPGTTAQGGSGGSSRISGKTGISLSCRASLPSTHSLTQYTEYEHTLTYTLTLSRLRRLSCNMSPFSYHPAASLCACTLMHPDTTTPVLTHAAIHMLITASGQQYTSTPAHTHLHTSRMQTQPHSRVLLRTHIHTFTYTWCTQQNLPSLFKKIKTPPAFPP